MKPIALATCAEQPDISADDLLFAKALQARGADALGAPWNSPAVPWDAFRAVVIRSTWDYHKQPAQFAAWLDTLASAGVPVLNPVGTIRWNADKRYLLELADAGLDVIPTRVCAWEQLESAIRPDRGRPVVIKPTISGNSWHTTRGIAGSDALSQAIDRLPPHLDYLVQPYLPDIESAGEWSLVFIDGHYSHAVRKRPAHGDYRVQSDFGGRATAEDPPATVLAAARDCLQALHTLGHGPQAYARIDGIETGGRFRLMELELIEPHLFLRSHPASADRLARAVLGRLPATGREIAPRVRSP